MYKLLFTGDESAIDSVSPIQPKGGYEEGTVVDINVKPNFRSFTDMSKVTTVVQGSVYRVTMTEGMALEVNAEEVTKEILVRDVKAINAEAFVVKVERDPTIKVYVSVRGMLPVKDSSIKLAVLTSLKYTDLKVDGVEAENIEVVGFDPSKTVRINLEAGSEYAPNSEVSHAEKHVITTTTGGEDVTLIIVYYPDVTIVKDDEITYVCTDEAKLRNKERESERWNKIIHIGSDSSDDSSSEDDYEDNEGEPGSGSGSGSKPPVNRPESELKRYYGPTSANTAYTDLTATQIKLLNYEDNYADKELDFKYVVGNNVYMVFAYPKSYGKCTEVKTGGNEVFTITENTDYFVREIEIDGTMYYVYCEQMGSSYTEGDNMEWIFS